MAGQTHEDVNQMFNQISKHLTWKSISVLKASFHPTPIVSHLYEARDYRQLSMESRILMQGHSSPHVFKFFRLREVAGEIVMSYKEWPYKSAPYKDVVVAEPAMGFTRDPDPISHKESRVITVMKEELRKWMDCGKVTDEEVEWWKQHLEKKDGWVIRPNHFFQSPPISTFGLCHPTPSLLLITWDNMSETWSKSQM